jgi:hypothetical protein
MNVTHLLFGKDFFLIDFFSVLIFVEKFNMESLFEFDGFLSWRRARGL